jgi:hypothetical protein
VNARNAVPASSPLMTRLLAIALVIVTLLPVLVFATDFTNSRALQSARERTVPRTGIRRDRGSPEARRLSIRARRATIHPTAPSVAMAFGFQLVMLTVLAVVGRRLFALRL